MGSSPAACPRSSSMGGRSHRHERCPDLRSLLGPVDLCGARVLGDAVWLTCCAGSLPLVRSGEDNRLRQPFTANSTPWQQTSSPGCCTTTSSRVTSSAHSTAGQCYWTGNSPPSATHCPTSPPRRPARPHQRAPPHPPASNAHDLWIGLELDTKGVPSRVIDFWSSSRPTSHRRSGRHARAERSECR